MCVTICERTTSELRSGIRPSSPHPSLRSPVRAPNAGTPRWGSRSPRMESPLPPVWATRGSRLFHLFPRTPLLSCEKSDLRDGVGCRSTRRTVTLAWWQESKGRRARMGRRGTEMRMPPVPGGAHGPTVKPHPAGALCPAGDGRQTRPPVQWRDRSRVPVLVVLSGTEPSESRIVRLAMAPRRTASGGGRRQSVSLARE